MTSAFFANLWELLLSQSYTHNICNCSRQTVSSDTGAQAAMLNTDIAGLHLASVTAAESAKIVRRAYCLPYLSIGT